jgi:ribosomal protein S18 acetylase RimI-like enzyme
MTSPRLRVAGPECAESIALLHANSWRRHYRGAYSDSFLDGDVVADRLSIWSARLATPARTETLVAEDGSRAVGFVHVILDDDPRWGSLIDNLHVVPDRQRSGIGSALLGRAAQVIVERATTRSMYLWVLKQNSAAQQFYRAQGGTCVEEGTASPPGGIPSRLNGTPAKLRIAWPDAGSVHGDGRL